MNHLIKNVTGLILVVSIYFFVLSVMAVHAAPVKRIGVFPVYMNTGDQTTVFDGHLHSKRMIRFINYWRFNTDFKVIDPYALVDEKQINRIMQSAKKDVEQLSSDLCDQYNLDAVVVVKIDIKALEFSDGYWKAMVHAVMDGFDEKGKSLEIADNEDIAITEASFDFAVKEAEKELGYRIARTLSIQLTNQNQIVDKTHKSHLTQTGVNNLVVNRLGFE